MQNTNVVASVKVELYDLCFNTNVKRYYSIKIFMASWKAPAAILPEIWAG